MARTKSISDQVLLRAARDVFVKGGFAASTKSIARRAGVSEGVLFQRFSTKEELFFAAMIPPAADLSGLFRKRHKDGYKAFSAVTLAMLDYFRATLPVLITLIAHPSFRFEEFASRHPDSPLVTLRRQITHFMLEERLAGRRYLFGGRLTEADVRLWVTLARFDAVYVTHFKANVRRLVDYPNLWGYARDLYQQPAFGPTTNFDHIKRHYYTTHPHLNPHRIVPAGPLLDWSQPHGRESLSA